MMSGPIDRTVLRGVRVLIVDDEPVLAATFCLVLKMAGAHAESALHGRAALAALEHERFDLILCDKHMPVMTGPEFIRELNGRGDQTPILLFVNVADITGVDRIDDLRIDGTLTKPLMPLDLVTAIRRTLDHTAPNGSSTLHN